MREVATAGAAQESAAPDGLTTVPLRHTGRWVVAALVLLLAIVLARSLVTNPRFEWDIVAGYLFDASILKGLWQTLLLTAIGMVAGIALGTIVALMRLSTNPIMSASGAAFTWFFRGTPLLVQIIFFYYLSALYPTIEIGVPFGPALLHVNANTVMTPLVASALALTLNEGAYMSEIVRAGIMSVDKGQTEAAQALGMSTHKTTRRIVLPQAMRVIIPPTGNETISMLKATSLVSVIAQPELLYSAQAIYSRTFETIPLLIVVTIWYLVATTLLSIGQVFLERHYGRGHGAGTDDLEATGLLRRVLHDAVPFRRRRAPDPAREGGAHVG